MFDAVKMMKSLSNLSFEELVTISITENAQSCSKPSKIELITAIIANRAAMANSSAPDRTRYRITEMDDTEHYVMLTPEQERFLRWSINNCIDYDRVEVDIIEDIDWETP